MIALRLFASAREAAGCGHDEYTPAEAATLGALLGAARARYGPEFEAVLATARVWINGEEPASGAATVLTAGDEVAVLPPVSGG